MNSSSRGGWYVVPTNELQAEARFCGTPPQGGADVTELSGWVPGRAQVDLVGVRGRPEFRRLVAERGNTGMLHQQGPVIEAES